MPNNDWWDRHIGTTAAAPPPRKAAQWEYNYPSPRQEPEPPPVDEQHYRVQTQGYDKKAPASKGSYSRCPSCGGSNFFRRKWAGKECAPLCVDCGHNGDYFEQSGTMLNGVGLHSSGPVQFARSANPMGESNFDAAPELVNAGWNPGAIR
jgi:hypothetical protein